MPVRVSRYVRVRAVDNAGNVGAASAAVSVIVGMTGALIGNVDITEEATLAIDGDDMWLVGVRNGVALEAYRCTVASSDCRQSPQWFHVGGVAPSFVPQVDLRGNVAFVAGGRALRMFYRDGDLLTARSCLKTSNCLSAGNWTRSTSYDFSNGYGSGNRVETLATGIGVFAYFTAGEGPSDNSWHLLATRCDRDGDYTGTCTPGIEPLLSITEGQAELGKPVADSTRLWIPFQRPALVLRPHEDCS